MRASPFHALFRTALFLAVFSACPFGASARAGGSNKDGGPSNGRGGIIIPGEIAKQRLEQAALNFSRLQTLPAWQSSPDAAAQATTIQDMIAKARESLAAGNNAAVLEACAQIDKRIGDLFFKLKSRPHGGEGQSPADDGGKGNGQNAGTLYELSLDLDRTNQSVAALSQRLTRGKNPCAAEVLGKIKALMDKARQATGPGRAASARGFLNQAQALLPELQRLAQEGSGTEKQGASELTRGACSEQQPTMQASLAQASDSYHRLLERYIRLTEQSGAGQNPKAAALKARIQEFLDKAKDALATGQPEVAREFCLRGESLLPELRANVPGAGGDRLGPATWQRLKAKLDRAAEIVSSSGNDKAAKILEKGRDHFERAQRDQADGQAARADVEMDIALKLAAKAVDIARVTGR